MKKLKSFKLFKEAMDTENDIYTDDFIGNDDVVNTEDEIDYIDDVPSFDDYEDEYSEDEDEYNDVTDEPNESISSLSDAKSWVLEHYDDEEVDAMKDKSVRKYIDPEEMSEQGYDSEYEYYIDHGKGEAESDVIKEIISEVNVRYAGEFSPEEEEELATFLRDRFDALKY